MRGLETYATSLAHILAELERVDLLVRVQLWRARQLQAADDGFQGLYLSEAELEALLAQPAHNVFYVNDGIVDDSAESDYQPRQHHDVDCRIKQGEHEQGDHNCQGDNRCADQGDTPIP